jgi:acylphosphatase
MTKHINIKISGWVLGVGFRYCAYEKFVELGLAGKAENTQDRGVLLDVEGSEEKLAVLLEWCHKGPLGAKVERVDVTELSEPFVPLKMG